MKRFFACLTATLGLLGVVALTGAAPAGADGPINPSYDCSLTPVAPGGLEGFDDVAIPIDVTDRTDPVPPGGTATYDVNLSLPALGTLPLPDGATISILRLSVEMPVPAGVSNVAVSYSNPTPQVANPPTSRWFDESTSSTLVAEFRRIGIGQGEISIAGDGTYSYGGNPVVPPRVSFTATAPNTPNATVQWTVPTVTANIRILSGHDLECEPQVPATVVVSTDTCDTEDFTDVSITHPFYCNIAWMNAQGISTGFLPGPTYRPGIAVSRQAMSAFLYRFAGEPTFTAPGTATFGDVSTSHPFFEEIEWMADTGISTGTPASPKPLYNPGAAVSRAAMAAFMYRFAGEPAFTAPGATTFGDVSTSHPFFEEIEWMADTGISTGTPASPKPLYKPADAVSRQAMSAFLNRLDTLLAAVT